LVRVWAIIAIALVAGALGDAGAEFSATFGWLGSTARDVDHQGVLPALAVAVTLVLGLAAYVIGSRIAPSDPLVRRLDDLRARTVDAIAALAGSFVTVIAVEGYETHFGGLAPFDANSIVIAHGPILLCWFVAVAVSARMMLGTSIRCASRGGALAAALLISFLRIARSHSPMPKRAMRFRPRTSCARVLPEIIKSRGLRAPPLALLSPA
jgi:hypothetical protein